jgi:glycogen operon protein
VLFLAPDWGHESHSLAVTVHLPGGRGLLHLVVNAYWEPLAFELPPLPAGAAWRRIIDTFRESPEDLCGWRGAEIVQGTHYLVQARTVVLLACPTLTGPSST